MSNPLVSISCITYNHAPYIRECLDGFLMQQCDFDFEILIHDDASTDGTQEIIIEYQGKYPDIIKPILQTENQWSQGVRGMNVKFNIPRAQGKYIALCEGDDYWTDPLKLQKQVDFLEENEDYVLVCTNAINGGKATELNRDISAFDILHHNPVKTLTVLLRREVINDYVPQRYTMGDFSFWLHIVKQGKLRYITDFTAYYRILPNSVSARTNLSARATFHNEVVNIVKQNYKEFDLNEEERNKVLLERFSYVWKDLKELERKKVFVISFLDYIRVKGSIDYNDLKYFVRNLF